ncbi:MAG: hypothetical protein DMG58_22535, partial [Acidobacteria bacterium]
MESGVGPHVAWSRIRAAAWSLSSGGSVVWPNPATPARTATAARTYPIRGTLHKTRVQQKSVADPQEFASGLAECAASCVLTSANLCDWMATTVGNQAYIPPILKHIF